MPAIISSSITPTPFFIFLSTILIGKGFKISKNLNRMKESNIQIIHPGLSNPSFVQQLGMKSLGLKRIAIKGIHCPTNSSITITYDNGTTIVDNSTIFASNSYKTFTVKPSDNLSNVTSYQIRIKSSVKDVAGNSLADDYSVSIGVDSYNLITGSISVNVWGSTRADWCSPLNNCSCSFSCGNYTSSAEFIASISGTYPPFSYEWYFDGTKESTSDNFSISYSAGNHKVKLYITDNQSNRINRKSKAFRCRYRS